jgi:predicted dehydrogenase
MKVAIIGVGRMGRHHIQVVKDLGLEVVGICDQSTDALDLATQEQGVSTTCYFNDAVEMLEKTNPECVMVATTATTHSKYTIMAAEAGAQYILCEKPMAVSLAQCDRMQAACSSRGVKLAINHQMRFMAQYQAAKEWADSEAFGGLKSVTMIAGNMGMAMNAVHYFEMFRYLTGEAPVEATAWFSDEKVPNPRGPQFEDRAGSVRLTTASGKRFYLEMGADQGHGIKIVLSGAYGQIVLDEVPGMMSLVVRKEEHRSEPSTRYGMPWVETTQKYPTGDAMVPTLSVLDALLKDQNPPSGKDGRLAVAALVAAYVSDETGHGPVSLQDANLPLDRVFPWA